MIVFISILISFSTITKIFQQDWKVTTKSDKNQQTTHIILLPKRLVISYYLSLFYNGHDPNDLYIYLMISQGRCCMINKRLLKQILFLLEQRTAVHEGRIVFRDFRSKCFFPKYLTLSDNKLIIKIF